LCIANIWGLSQEEFAIMIDFEKLNTYRENNRLEVKNAMGG
jgi:hypothetical protein